MPFRRSYRKPRRRAMARASSITHIPSTMDQNLAANILTIIYSTVSTVVAGVSATTGRLDTDRDREVSNGERVGFTRFTLQLEPAATAMGTLEWVLFKVERSSITPVVGTHPIPTSATVDGQGIQQAFRLNMSTWVCKFGAFPIAPETPRVIHIGINWSKFKKGTVKDGDHYGIALFNRTTGSIDYSVQMMYKSWR